MKSLKYIFTFVLIFTASLLPVSALSCSNSVNKDLTKVASYVKANYEVEDKSETKSITANGETTEYKIPKFIFDISVYNITSEVYVTVEDNVTESSITITNDMTTDNAYTFQNDDFGRVYNYTIIVRSANEECYGDKIRTIKLTKPKYNAYSEFSYCRNSSSLYCQKFTTSNLNIDSTSDFLNKISANNKNPNKKNDNSETITDIIKDNWKIYLIVFAVVIVILVAVLVFLIRRRKKRGTTL